MNKPTSPNQIVIIKKSTCPKLSLRAKGTLTYHVGHDDSSKTFHLRVTANKGGFFSKEWISLDDILATIEEQSLDDQFKAIIFQPMRVSGTVYLIAASSTFLLLIK